MFIDYKNKNKSSIIDAQCNFLLNIIYAYYTFVLECYKLVVHHILIINTIVTGNILVRFSPV